MRTGKLYTLHQPDRHVLKQDFSIEIIGFSPFRKNIMPDTNAKPS